MKRATSKVEGLLASHRPQGSPWRSLCLLARASQNEQRDAFQHMERWVRLLLPSRGLGWAVWRARFGDVEDRLSLFGLVLRRLAIEVPQAVESDAAAELQAAANAPNTDVENRLMQAIRCGWITDRHLRRLRNLLPEKSVWRNQLDVLSKVVKTGECQMDDVGGRVLAVSMLKESSMVKRSQLVSRFGSLCLHVPVDVSNENSEVSRFVEWSLPLKDAQRRWRLSLRNRFTSIGRGSGSSQASERDQFIDWLREAVEERGLDFVWEKVQGLRLDTSYQPKQGPASRELAVDLLSLNPPPLWAEGVAELLRAICSACRAEGCWRDRQLMRGAELLRASESALQRGDSQARDEFLPWRRELQTLLFEGLLPPVPWRLATLRQATEAILERREANQGMSSIRGRLRYMRDVIQRRLDQAT